MVQLTLLVDDVRNLFTDIVSRNYKSAVTVLSGIGYTIDTLYIDHDLGEVKTGYDVLEYGIKSGTLPDKIVLVSMNPVGVKRMKELLMDNGYSQTEPYNFER